MHICLSFLGLFGEFIWLFIYLLYLHVVFWLSSRWQQKSSKWRRRRWRSHVINFCQKLSKLVKTFTNSKRQKKKKKPNIYFILSLKIIKFVENFFWIWTYILYVYYICISGKYFGEELGAPQRVGVGVCVCKCHLPKSTLTASQTYTNITYIRTIYTIYVYMIYSRHIYHLNALFVNFVNLYTYVYCMDHKNVEILLWENPQQFANTHRHIHTDKFIK